MHFKKILPLLLAFTAIAFLGKAQVTTGSVTGTVKANDGKELVGATVVATLESTGSVYRTVSKAGGQFTLPNLRVGGPYVINITYTGYTPEIYRDVNVSLGTPVVVDVTMKVTSQELGAVTVTTTAGKGAVINSQRNGASTYISQRLVQSLPTINRSVQDFARLTPQVKAGNAASSGNVSGLSFSGQSNRYNQFSIDGANASDAFGLGSSGTNGGQANVNPISIDAIQEIQIVLSPYDVTQGGFTGGGINAVTKSGTNKLHGSVYIQNQTQGLVGKNTPYNSTIIRSHLSKFSNRTYGASLGGAIIKNKLFFFANFERFEKSTPLNFDPTVAGSGSKANKDTLQAIRDFMIKNYYDPGDYGAINNDNESSSAFGRIDWNINDKHKLTFRHNFVDGSNDVLSRTATSVVFSNSGYKFTTQSNSSVIELNSSFNSSMSNVLRLTYNRIRDRRISNKFGALTIVNFDLAQNANITYNLGSDFSSQANSLDQDIISVTDNFTLNKGKHTFTFGTNNEFFKSGNVFLQGFYGSYSYSAGSNSRNNITNFYNNTGLTSYSVGYSTAGRGDRASADLKAAQYGVYAQDVWSPKRNFKLTYGVRADLPVINSRPAENAAFNAAFASYDVRTNELPKRRIMLSPRVGFNWDVEGNGQLQVRGGAGVFTGRVPFVWISNQLSNTGVSTKSNSFTAAQIIANGIKYTYDPNEAQAGAYIPASSAAAAPAINVIDKNFKFPQVFRANLAADRRLGAGFTLTLEALYTKNINNASYSNLNLSDNGESTTTIGSTTRPLWTKYQNTNYLQVIKLSNTNKGYSANFTAQLQKSYSKGWGGSIAYTYGTASSLNDLPSSVALSNWRGVHTINGLNKPDFTESNFSTGSRVVGYLSKEFRYFKHFATTFTLFYTGQSGQRFSYLYANANIGLGSNTNITGDDINSTTATSLAYIPATFSEANFADITNGKTASQQWADFLDFAKANKYLSQHMGQNSSRNGDKLPWENHFDFRVSQDFMLSGKKLQLFFDVVNLGALLDKNGGRAYGGSGADGFFPVTTLLFTPITGTTLKQDGANLTATAQKPAFQFNINNFTKIGDVYRPYAVADFTSRWSAQVGAKFTF